MYQESNQERFLKAAICAADWLLENQSSDGYWQDYQGYGSLRSIDARVSWALLSLYEIVKKNKYKEAACRQLDWVIKHQLLNGWFDNCFFYSDRNPVTHTIAYVVEGLLESAIILNQDHYYLAAKLTADVLLSCILPSGYIPGKFDKFWHPVIQLELSHWKCSICQYLDSTCSTDRNSRVCPRSQASFIIYSRYPIHRWGP